MLKKARVLIYSWFSSCFQINVIFSGRIVSFLCQSNNDQGLSAVKLKGVFIMTVEYNHIVSTSRGLGNFGKLLIRWKGSIYKLVYPDLILYFTLYMTIFIIYRFVLNNNSEHKRIFELIAKYCSDYGQAIPVSFVLGFYISQIVSRWWSQFMTCPWPDTLSILIATHLQGSGERSRLMRRTMMRYVNMSFTLTMIMMSPQAKARFPTLDHLVEAGFLMPHEKVIIEHLNQKSDYSKYWIPLIWAGSVAIRARREGRIADDMALNTIVEAICKFRAGLGDLLGYDWVNLPLVYTQVVTLAIYLYFFAGLFGRQILISQKDTYFPVFLFAEFFFYMGWLKVGETMLNPWGEDDDDFEVNWLIDRNFTVAYLIVDEMHAEHPEMLKDTYWDDVVPEELPYTEATLKFKKNHQGSAEAKDEEKSEIVATAPDRETVGTQRVASIFRRGTTMRVSLDAKDMEKAMQKGGGVVSRQGSKLSAISAKSNDHYKMYMDQTFIPMNKDAEENN